jgi:hypothetical protein
VAEPFQGTRQFEKTTNIEDGYQLDNLPGGNYRILAIIDLNMNDTWDKGGTNPWKFAEPFIFKSDTIRVRKRWTTQGINCEFTFR